MKLDNFVPLGRPQSDIVHVYTIDDRVGRF